MSDRTALRLAENPRSAPNWRARPRPPTVHQMTQGELDLWTTPFHDLAPEDQKWRLSQAFDLTVLLRVNLSYPGLSEWEIRFQAQVLLYLMDSKGTARISPKQWRQIWIIAATVDRGEWGHPEMSTF